MKKSEPKKPTPKKPTPRKLITIAPGVTPFQLEGFPEKAERSVKGALHLSGRSTKVITADELVHLQKMRPDLAGKITIRTKLGELAGSAKPAQSSASASASGSEAGDEGKAAEAAAEAPEKGKKGKGKKS